MFSEGCKGAEGGWTLDRGRVGFNNFNLGFEKHLLLFVYVWIDTEIRC